jgi:hypothetical protein
MIQPQRCDDADADRILHIRYAQSAYRAAAGIENDTVRVVMNEHELRSGTKLRVKHRIGYG